GVSVGSGTSAGVSLGAAVAVNVVTDTVRAFIDASTVTAGGNVNLEATGLAAVRALSIGAAAAVGVSSGNSNAGALTAGAAVSDKTRTASGVFRITIAAGCSLRS